MYRNPARAAAVIRPWPAATRPSSSRKAAPPRRIPTRSVSPGPAQPTPPDALEIFRRRRAFVRKPASAAPIAILSNRHGTRCVVVDDAGRIHMQPALTVRA